MGKKPTVERDTVSGGLTYESASRWLMFMAEEADFAGDSGSAESYRQRAMAYMRFPNGSLHDKNLEKEIKKWRGKSNENK